MKKFVCSVCGYVYEGEEAPEFCPVCKAPREKFNEVTGEMAWADEHRIGVAKGVEEDIVEDLRANFMGECTEVGMYLAMSRQADREGYPEVGEATSALLMKRQSTPRNLPSCWVKLLPRIPRKTCAFALRRNMAQRKASSSSPSVPRR